MYDTVVAAIDLDKPLDDQYFQEGQTLIHKDGTATVRLWHNGGGDYAPRLTYWRGVKQMAGRLRAEFSIPKMAHIGVYDNPTEREKYQALGDVTAYINMLVNAELPHIRVWRASRIDYAWNWDVGDQLPVYLAMLQRLHPGALSRQEYPNAGVSFKTRASNGRTIKFYDKAGEQGMKNGHILRYEVSNFKRVIPYMTERWYGCARSVGDLLHPGRALVCMAIMWMKLGLSHADTGYGDSEASLLLRMRRDYGTSSPGAYYALMCIRSYGKQSVSLGLMSDNSFYAWRKKLTDHNYMIDTQYQLPALHLPTHILQEHEDSELPQNLGRGDTPPAKIDKKILAAKLGVKSPALIPNYLLRRYDAQSDATRAA